MARQRQRTSSSKEKEKTAKKATGKKGSVGKTAPKAKSKPKVQRVQAEKIVHAVRYGDCMDCLVSLKKYGEGGSIGGVLCPPCATARLVKELGQRREQGFKEHLAVLIPVNGEKRQIDLNVEDVSTVLGGSAVCTLYHSQYANATRGLNIHYTAWIRDLALLERQPDNHTALGVLGRLGGFHERTDESCCGPVVITGTDGLSLFLHEVDLIMRP